MLGTPPVTPHLEGKWVVLILGSFQKSLLTFNEKLLANQHCIQCRWNSISPAALFPAALMKVVMGDVGWKKDKKTNLFAWNTNI